MSSNVTSSQAISQLSLIDSAQSCRNDDLQELRVQLLPMGAILPSTDPCDSACDCTHVTKPLKNGGWVWR